MVHHIRALAAALVFVLLVACASKTTRGAPDADVARQWPVESAAVVEPDPGALLSSPELDRIEALIIAGDVDAARTSLSNWAAGDLTEHLSALGNEVSIAAALEIDRVAQQLSLNAVQLVAREHVHAVRERILPAEHPELLAAKQSLAVTRAQLGDLSGAHALFEHVHAARERLLPPDHIDLLMAKQNLAVARKRFGDLLGALALEEHVHAACERLLSADHVDLLRAKQNLAISRKRLGNLAGALELEEQVHVARERLLQADHADLLSAKQNLAVTRKLLGDIEGARALEEHVHAARERLLPPDHLDLLAAKSSLASTRRALGDLAGAHALFEYVHAARERLLPAEHPDLLTTKANLALTRSALGDLDGALELEEYVHAVRQRLLPADHPDLLNAKLNLSLTRSTLGDLEGALSFQEHVHSAYERLMPADHPGLLKAKSNLALTRHELGDLAGAHTLIEHVHAAYERLLAADHPDLLAAKSNLASTSKALGDLAGALALEEYVHSARERLLPADHPDLLGAKTGLAGTRSALGDLVGAHALFEQVHTARQRLLPADHPDVLAAKLNLAMTRKDLGDLAGALALLQHVHTARERLLLADHPDLLATKQVLSLTLSELGDHIGALALAEHVHSARERLLPADHPDLLTAKQNLAATRTRSGDSAGALALEEYVHSARVRLLPKDHPDVFSAKQNLAVTRRILGDLAGAHELFKEVHAARARLLPDNHPHLLSAKQNLAATSAELGDHEELRATALSLIAGQNSLAGTLAAHAPRVARSTALRELERLSKIARWSESLTSVDEPDMTPELVSSLESLRVVSTASPETARAASVVPELRAAIDELARVRRALADRSQATPSEAVSIDAWRNDLVRLSEERDGLERHVRLQLSGVGVAVDIPTVESIAAALTPSSAYVGFWRYKRYREPEVGGRNYVTIDSLLAFVVTPDGAVRRSELGAAALIESTVSRWRASLGAALETRGPGLGIGERNDEEAAEAGAALRALVLDPIFALAPNAKELHCVLDDVLFLVPLDALPLDGGVVGDRYTLRVGSTVRQVLPRGERDADAPSLLVLGGVDYSGAGDEPEAAFLTTATPPLDRAGSGVLGASFDALPGASLESELVAARFSETFALEPTVIRGGDATKAALVEHVENARYLHVATHGWFALESAAVSMLDGVGEDASDELRLSVDRAQETIVGFLPETLCGLALAGANNGPEGILTAEELATLDLSKCELAVLSACETNVGIRRAGQGIQSLQTALHAAGARTAITSLWKVDDAATRRLFELFYTKLWAEKLGPADALWQAKMALRSEGHPTRDWAGWVLTGDPD